MGVTIAWIVGGLICYLAGLWKQHIELKEMEAAKNFQEEVEDLEEEFYAAL